MTTSLSFDPVRLSPKCEALRTEVRAFLAQEASAGTFDPHHPGYSESYDRDFSRRVGAKGWIGMTWPKQYGGHGAVSWNGMW
jgi:acyl-CoA dehydrogenase